jgi:hypothetical protein
MYVSLTQISPKTKHISQKRQNSCCFFQKVNIIKLKIWIKEKVGIVTKSSVFIRRKCLLRYVKGSVPLKHSNRCQVAPQIAPHY